MMRLDEATFAGAGEHQKKEAFKAGNDLINTIMEMSKVQRNVLRNLLGI